MHHTSSAPRGAFFMGQAMLKRLFLSLGVTLLAASSWAAGTVPGFNLVPQFDLSGKLAPGCKLYVIQAGTTSTPQNSYQDSGLTLVNPNPLTCDASGRLPQWFVADGSIKLRLTTATGTPIFTGDNLLVIGASSGGGGGSPVDPTTVLTTGDFKMVYGTGSLSGFVRCNGRTIGNASSGATERANADTSALFSFLWNNDANLAVSGGRGASAAADYAANKTIALPDCRGRALAGLDDMGNSAAGRLTVSYFGTSATVLGAAGGAESHTLTTAQMPVHSHGVTDPGHSHGEGDAINQSSSAQSILPTGATLWAGANTSTASATTGISIQNAGSGAAHNNTQPTILMTIQIKL
jgi:microcystin-dependent protein